MKKYLTKTPRNLCRRFHSNSNKNGLVQRSQIPTKSRLCKVFEHIERIRIVFVIIIMGSVSIFIARETQHVANYNRVLDLLQAPKARWRACVVDLESQGWRLFSQGKPLESGCYIPTEELRDAIQNAWFIVGKDLSVDRSTCEHDGSECTIDNCTSLDSLDACFAKVNPALYTCQQIFVVHNLQDDANHFNLPARNGQNFDSGSFQEWLLVLRKDKNKCAEFVRSVERRLLDNMNYTVP